MKLVIVTPQESSTMDEVDIVTIPGSEGSFTVLRNHAPLVSAIRKGVIRCNQKEIATEGGVVKVENDVITVISEQ